jgi:hypothetical protein
VAVGDGTGDLLRAEARAATRGRVAARAPWAWPLRGEVVTHVVGAVPFVMVVVATLGLTMG